MHLNKRIPGQVISTLGIDSCKGETNIMLAPPLKPQKLWQHSHSVVVRGQISCTYFSYFYLKIYLGFKTIQTFCYPKYIERVYSCYSWVCVLYKLIKANISVVLKHSLKEGQGRSWEPGSKQNVMYLEKEKFVSFSRFPPQLYGKKCNR